MGKEALIKQGWLRALTFIVVFLSANIFLDPLIRLWAGTRGSVTEVAKNTVPGLAEDVVVRLLLSFVVSVLLVWLFRKFVDARSFLSLGLSWKNHLSHAATGFFTALFLLGAGTLILSAGGFLQWLDFSFDASSLFTSLGLIVFASFAEELVFRGYLLNNLMDSVNKWMALAVSAFVFALFHRLNPGMNPVAFMNIFLGGLLLGINFIYTRNLWFGILLHLTWNFYQGPVLGYNLSGLQLQSILQQELTGNAVLTGGPFGFEGSAINSGLMLVAILSLAWLYNNRHGQGKIEDNSPLPGSKR